MNTYYLPTHIVAACGALNELGKEAAALGQSALLVCGGKSAKSAGYVERATEILTQAGVQVTLYEGIAAEPELEMVERGLKLAAANHIELVIGLGGGSPMDTAKAIAGLAGLEGSVREYFQGKPITANGLPFIAIPTTSGTGAEVTKNAVLTDAATGIKQSIRDDRWYARTAIIDPKLTLSLPPKVTASSGSDALCQAIEAYTSIGASPITDALARRAVQLIGNSLEASYQDGSNLAAREDMAYGSLMAGMAMGNARLGGVHGMAHPLGARYHIPHGTVCGLLLPYTMVYNIDYAQTKYAAIARMLSNETPMDEAQAAREAVDKVKSIIENVGIPLHLAEFGVERSAFKEIIAESLPSSSLKHNPRPLGHDDVLAILEAAL